MNHWNIPNPVETVAFLLNTILSLTIISAIALLIARLTFHHNPSVRYFACLSSLICVLVCPLCVGVFRQMGFGLVTLPLRQSAISSQYGDSTTNPTFVSVENASSNESRFNSLFARREMLAVNVALCVWGGGVVWGIARLVQGMRTAAFLAQGVHAWEGLAEIETTSHLSSLSGTPTPPVFISRTLRMPVAVGLFHPMVILPEQLVRALSPSQLRHVLLHEYSHIAYRHSWGAIAERAVKILFWFHPIIRLLCQELANAREEVCDNVASQETGAACYARTLLTIAQGDFTAPNIASTLSLFGQESSLESRIAGLLHPRRNRMIRMKKWMIWSGAGIAVSALSLTTLVRVVADDTKSKTSARNSNVLNNAPEFNRKTVGTALDNRILSDNLMYNEKSGGFAVTQIKSLELSKLDGSNEKLEYKARAEKKAHGKSPKGGHTKANVPGDSVSDEHAAKLKAESEANGVAPTGSTEKTPSPLSTVASKRIAKLKAEAEWLGKKNSSDNPNAGVQKSVSIPDQHSAKLDAEAKSKP